MAKDHTRSVIALNALVRRNNLGVDARKKLTSTQTEEISRWRERDEELSLSTARAEAIRPTEHVLDLGGQLDSNDKQLDALVKVSEAAPLPEEKGFGAATAANFVAWSPEGRVRKDAAFACLVGVNPIPASSGSTTLHRLKRGRDRALNSALHIAAITRMIHPEDAREYVGKRRAQGMNDKEIRRCLKRHLARPVFRILNASVESKGLQNAA